MVSPGVVSGVCGQWTWSEIRYAGTQVSLTSCLAMQVYLQTDFNSPQNDILMYEISEIVAPPYSLIGLIFVKYVIIYKYL